MKHIFLFLLLLPVFLHAQFEKVIVETYYVSDSLDATDTTGGIVEAGSKAYRIYIDLKPGVKLRKLYGDANHALKISSTAVFFNNKADGQTFGKDFSKNRYKENTVALDTWLTLGQLTKTSSKTYFGILKANDTNGSFVGGANNDGGSEMIRGGLLVNTDSSVGIPLTVADGIDSMLIVPTNWASFGFIDMISNEDSTIFGSVIPDSQFVSNNAALQNSGVMGVLPNSNQVLVAQLTTKGEISFELNIEVEDTNGNTIKYVANGDTLLPGEQVSPKLKYPPPCGCIDPNYLEYSSNFSCNLPDACKTPVVLGCTDPMACNYDPHANFSIPSLCCYPGSCSDRDIKLVCPYLGMDDPAAFIFELYPNPVEDDLSVRVPSQCTEKINYRIYDCLGRALSEKDNITITTNHVLHLDVSDLPPGIYLLHLSGSEQSGVKRFTKKKI